MELQSPLFRWPTAGGFWSLPCVSYWKSKLPHWRTGQLLQHRSPSPLLPGSQLLRFRGEKVCCPLELSFVLYHHFPLRVITFANLSRLPGLFLELLRSIHCEANQWPVFIANILMPPIACSSSIPGCCGCSNFFLSSLFVKLLAVLFV